MDSVYLSSSMSDTLIAQIGEQRSACQDALLTLMDRVHQIVISRSRGLDSSNPSTHIGSGQLEPVQLSSIPEAFSFPFPLR